MGYRAAVCALAVLCCVGVQAQSFNGSFTIQDPTQVFGPTKTPQTPLNQSNASFIPIVFTDSKNVPVSLSFEVIGNSTVNNEDWIFSFSNGGDPAPAGSYSVGGNAKAFASMHLFFGATCVAQSGTVTLNAASGDPRSGVVNQLALSYNLDCGLAKNISGSFSYLSTSGSGGGGGGGGTGGGGGSVSTGAGSPPNLGKFPIGGGTSGSGGTSGGGGGTTTPPAPEGPAIVLTGPSLVTDLNSGETATVDLATSANSTFSSDVTFRASGPAGMTFAFSPSTIKSPGSGTTKLTLGTSGSLQTGLQRVEVIAQGANGVIGRTAFNVFVSCDPPLVLGVDQPRNTTIGSGQTAKLTVTPTGSAPFAYQWYEGHRGSLVFPIDGATSATFTTPALTAGTEYWVRVTNPCGAVDSQNVSVNVNR